MSDAEHTPDNDQTHLNPDEFEEMDSTPPPAPGIEPGIKLGNFVLEKLLGTGGMGEVWLGYQEAMDRHVAVKILSPMFTRNDDFVSRFTKEMKVSAKLEHPNIVTAHDAGFEHGVHYLAMSYVEGEDLTDRLDRERLVEETEALTIIRKIARALKYAWDEHKLLHRDIKPSNIMLDRNGEPKLMDMGISKCLSEDSGMTMTGAVIGTPHYVSLEQAQGRKDLDLRADIYSLGATLYHITVGSPPYEATTSMGILTRLATEDLVPPRKRNPNLSLPCNMLIEIMMAKDRENRQASWDEVLEDIDLVLSGKAPQTPMPEGSSREELERELAAQAEREAAEKKKGTSTAARTAVLAGVGALIVVGMIVSVRLLLPKKDVPEPHPTPVKPDAPPPDKTIPDNPPEPVMDKPQPPASNKDAAEKLWEMASTFAAQAIADNQDFDQAITNFEKMKTNFPATEYEMKADIEISKLRKAKDKAIQSALNELARKAAEKIAAGNLTEAADLYQKYNGPFMAETQIKRLDLAAECRGATARFNGCSKSLATSLIANDFSKALRTYQTHMAMIKTYFPTTFPAYQQLFTELNTYLEKGSSDTSPYSVSTKGIITGCRQAKAGNYDKAMKNFESAELLQESLMEACKLQQRTVFEAAAKDEMGKLLKQGGLNPAVMTTMGLLNQLKARKLEIAQAQAIISGLQNYRKAYKTSKFVNEKADFIETLESSANARLKRKTKLLPDTQDAVDNISEAADSALDIFLKDDQQKDKE